MKRQKKDGWKFIMKKREKLKDVYIKAKKKVNEQFRRKMNENMNENRKLVWKEERLRIAAK